MSVKIFLLEDDEDISFAVKKFLEKNGFEVKTFSKASELYKALESEVPDIFIIDIMLPESDGFSVARFLKMNPRFSEIPLIFLTARISEEDKLRGFEIGADDYITKPFSLRELLARVKAVLKRYKKEERKIIKIKELTIDKEKVKVFIKDKEISLTPSEFKILLFLVENTGKVLSREEILNSIWDLKRDAAERTVDVHIKHLRDKLGEYGKFIKTVRGFGYVFEY